MEVGIQDGSNLCYKGELDALWVFPVLHESRNFKRTTSVGNHKWEDRSRLASDYSCESTNFRDIRYSSTVPAQTICAPPTFYSSLPFFSPVISVLTINRYGVIIFVVTITIACCYWVFSVPFLFTILIFGSFPFSSAISSIFYM